jgi:hypothetical protein
VRRVLLLPVLCLLAACSGSSPASPSASVTEPPTSTTTTSVEAEVEAAYLRSWEVYAKAMLELDESRLGEVFARRALDLRRTEVADLRRKGTPARMQVEHRIAAVSVRDDAAYVTDNYVNHSVVLDPISKEPAEPDPNSSESRTYTLERIDGAWRVTFVLDNSQS